MNKKQITLGILLGGLWLTFGLMLASPYTWYKVTCPTCGDRQWIRVVRPSVTTSDTVTCNVCGMQYFAILYYDGEVVIGDNVYRVTWEINFVNKHAGPIIGVVFLSTLLMRAIANDPVRRIEEIERAS